MPVLDLPKSKLTLDRDELLKLGPDDTVVARYRTDQILGLGIEQSRDFGAPLVFAAVFLSLAFVSFRFVEAPGWSWAGTIVCLGVSALSLMSIQCQKLVISTSGGTVRYPVLDLVEEAEGFVVSANSILELGGEDDDKQLVAANDRRSD